MPAQVGSGYKNKTFKLPRDLAEKAEAKAARMHRALNSIVEEALAAFVEERDDYLDEVEALNARAARRRGRQLEVAEPFSRDDLHER